MRSSTRTRVLAALGILVGIVVAITIAGATYEPDTRIPSTFVGRHVDVEGLPIRVLQRGRGRDVVLIHASPGSIEDWSTVIDTLATRYRVTAFDRPAHGLSGDDGDYSYAHNATVARRLIDTLGLEHAIVVGHSYGGTTALAMAAAPSPRVDGYVIIGSSTYRASRPITGLFRMLYVPWFGMGFARVLPSSVVAGKIRDGIRPQFRGAQPSESFVVFRSRLWNSPKVIHAIAEETVGANGWLRALAPRYRHIASPVALLGQRDDEFRRRSLERLHRDLPNATLQLLPGTGHYVQVERPAAVIAAIDGVAARVPRP